MIQRQLRRLVVPMLLPALALHLLFFVLPVARSFHFAFTSWSGITPDMTFVGFANFVRALHDRTFLAGLENVLCFSVLGFLLVFPLSLLFAIVLDSKPPGERVLKFVIFAPTLLSVVVTAVLWGSVFNPVIGLLNESLRAVGLSGWAQPWLGRRGTALPAISVAMVWQGLGTYVILFLAGLQKIPRSFYDAADMDGAGTWQRFRHVTLPLLWDVVQILVVLWVINSVQAFALIFVMTRGYPNVAEVMGTYIYWAGFQGQSVGYATAMGVLMFVLVLALAVVVNRAMRRETLEY